MIGVGCVMVCTVLTLVVGLHDDSPYCAVRYRRLCQGKGWHVGCQFPQPGPGIACANYSPIKFQDSLKHFITHYINSHNKTVTEWDRELASLAQRLADQCNFVHDECRATVRYPYAGQTVGEVRWRRSSDSDVLTAQRAIRRVFDAWWGERRRVLPNQLTAPFRLTAKGAVWGHFSQLAVWSLRAVGCGAVRHGAYYPRLLLVCDFSHTNMLGQRTISPGPLAHCPPHFERRARSAYPLLCATVRHPAPTEHYEAESTEDYWSDDEDENTSLLSSFPDSHKSHATTQKTKIQFLTTRTVDRNTEWRTDNTFQGVIQTRTKGALIHKLDRELEYRNKANNKVWLGFVDDANWRSSVPADEKPKKLLNTEQETKQGTGKGLTTLYDGILEYRRRPNISEQGSLRLDKDDIDQLFKDTGFNPHWLKRRPAP
ncbi:unnamed protein product [Diatraea saccharalis]|uniref:SCP domain-containing protein n=1 Tax=Diatraea saccharalis TaxID=40085 RepID=A0A9N9RC59_9NEOP|nr:unnamed protein product [Diatraea saccharalis]